MNPQTSRDQFKLRIPPALKSRLNAQAIEHRRSLNAEIIVLLENALPTENEKADTAGTVSA